jgi:general secretion pathway protein M
MIAKQLNVWWTGLARRERAMVLVASAVVFLGLLYALAIEPAWTTKARLARELPRLQAELVQLEALRTEAQRLGGRDGAGESFDSLLAAVEQSVLRANLAANVQAEDQNTVTVTADSVSAGAWFTWLEALSRESRVAVTVASAQRADNPGRIRASVSFYVDSK